MAKRPEKAELDALQARIDEARAAQAPSPPADEHYSQAQQGWRMVTELVAGILIGFVVGYGLDTFLGTMPIFLVLFVLLGFVAGVKTMLATAKEIERKSAASAAADKGDEDGGRSI
ncbi:MAG: AtpZ/AtpI family protein [Pseudomonadota bacterium]